MRYDFTETLNMLRRKRQVKNLNRNFQKLNKLLNKMLMMEKNFSLEIYVSKIIDTVILYIYLFLE